MISTSTTSATATTDRATVLFTDMEGSTEVSSARGDELAMTLLRVHESAARDAASQHHGRVIKSTGDGFLLAFETSVDAVAAAMALADRLRRHNAEHPDDPVPVRMGINAGAVIEEGGDLYGLAVNAAARIAAKAKTGQILVSDVVRTEAVGVPDCSFVDRGPFWLKGLREQWRLFEAARGDVVEAAGHLGDRSPFVDRELERASLRRSIDAANEGAGGFILISADPGGGKTRLAEEIGDEAQGRGLHFAAGHCYESWEAPPYTPIVAVLEAIERRVSRESFRDALGDLAGEIARMVPQLRDRYQDIPPATEWPVQEERRYLFASLRDVLARLAALRPMVILLDDLHWADDSTLRLVDQLADDLATLPILVIGTYSNEELTEARPFRTFLGSWHRRRLVQSIEVPPLGRGDVATMLANFGRSTPPAQVVDVLHETTGGNPFFVEEVVRHLAEHGVLLDAKGEWCTPAEVMDFDLPESVRFTIDDRLEHLAQETRDVLAIAAVVGRDFGFELIEELAGLTEDELLDALDQAEWARLIVSRNEAETVRFSFAHGLIRRILTADVSLTRRQRLHLRVADALELVYANNLAEHVADIAAHLVHAGRWANTTRTRRFLMLAGDRALEAAAYAEALRHFDRASALVPADDVESRAAVLSRMGIAERSLGNLDDALALWDEALTAYESIDMRAATARLCLDAGIQVAWWRRGREVRALVDRGLRALGDDDVAVRAGLLALAGGVASQAGSYNEATALLDDALAIARRHGDDGVLGLTLYSLATHEFSYTNYENVLTAATASVQHLQRAGDTWNLANVQGYLGAALGWLGRFDEAAAVGEEAETLAQRLGNWSAYIFAEQACAFRDIGSQPGAMVLAARGQHALELGLGMGFGWLTSIGHARMGLAAFWSGQWETALDHFDEAARGELRSASGGHLGRLFLIHAYLGHQDIALELIDRARPELAIAGRPNSGTSSTLSLAAVEALAILGAHDEAARLYRVIVEYAATGSLMRNWDFRLTSTLAGIAAGSGGEWNVAEDHFRDARGLARSLPMRMEEPEALRFHAQTLLRRAAPGDRDAAESLLGEAAKLYDELAMPRHALLAREMLSR